MGAKLKRRQAARKTFNITNCQDPKWGGHEFKPLQKRCNDLIKAANDQTDAANMQKIANLALSEDKADETATSGGALGASASGAGPSTGMILGGLGLVTVVLFVGIIMYKKSQSASAPVAAATT